MTKTIVRTLARGSLPGLLLGALVLGPTARANAQTSLDQVPADLRRLMIFAPDPKKLSYLEGPGVRQLQFEREEKHEDKKFCNYWYGNRVIVSIEDQDSPAIAHHQFEVTRLQRENIAQVTKVASSLAGTDETAVFEGNYLSKEKCGTFQRETVFRIGKWKVFLMEDYFNGAAVTSSIAPGLVAALRGEASSTPAEVASGAAPDAGSKSSVRIEGNTIYVTDGSGTERVVTLVSPTKGSPPVFSPPTVSGEAKAFEKYVVTHMFEASYAHLPPDQRLNFISGMPMPSDVAGEAAQAALDAGESAANWVRDNPADASLMVLSTAVSLAFPLSAFANPAVATGGAAVLRGVVGTAMVAGTSGFVQKLMSNVFTDQTALQRFKEAAAKGAGDAVATVPGSLAGAGVEKVAEQIIAKAAVTAGSVAVGIATDKAMEKLQVSEKTAALVMKAPSYASSLLTLPGPSPEPGGMSLNFDR